MIQNRLYYSVKPAVPRPVRMVFRRWFAERMRRQTDDAWPIQQGSERKPDGWSPWPQGRHFALVLTHDVEGKAGLAKCRQLMELESELGFYSSFNFIPEGPYRDTKPIRDHLTRSGFEVGVHDLYHDGKLYRSKEDFIAKAARINSYLQDWGAVGFRSGFMHHRLDWLHHLNIAYDASTFDTDPFEPQPDGVGSIFPFWVPHQPADVRPPTSALRSPLSASAAGCVELPYTLPQDSTLFLLFRERSPEIWLSKLDWLARNGGLALVNVHPDYLRFPGEPDSTDTYPVEFYSQLLRHVRDRYSGAFWHPLPREMAAFVASTRPTLPKRSHRRICMVTHSFYENDNRVMRYAEALAGRGDEVDVMALRRSPETPPNETICGVKVFRTQMREGKKEQSKLSYLLPLVRFLVTSSWRITRAQSRRRYDLIHVHNIPDFLVFSAFYPKLTGTRVILDIHDIVPEFFGSKFGAASNSLAVRALKWVERRSAAVAHHVILANHLWLDRYVARSAPAHKCSVFINNVDTRVFYPRPRTRKDDRTIILFPGGMQWHQGLDIVIKAFPQVLGRVPKAELHFYGDGNMKPQLIQLTHDLGLDDKVKFFEPLRVREIAEIMANADLGVVPKRADSFGNEAYSTKIMEFMSLGVPVVVSATKIDRFYFNDSVVRFFESGNHHAMAEAICEVLTDADLRRRLVNNALEFARTNSWESRRSDYFQLVDSLCTSGHPTPSDEAEPRLSGVENQLGVPAK